MAGVLKKTTGLTGLAVAKTPHHTLTLLYQKCLVSLGKLPESAVYRKTTEPLIREKLAFVEAEKDIAELEKKLGYQVEESIKLAENELYLARMMTQWKAWEPLVARPPPDQWKWPM